MSHNVGEHKFERAIVRVLDCASVRVLECASVHVHL